MNIHEETVEPVDADETEEPCCSNRLQLLPAVKRTGRTKGCNTTVIGLRKAKRYKKTRLAFTELSKQEQQTHMQSSHLS